MNDGENQKRCVMPSLEQWLSWQFRKKH